MKVLQINLNRCRGAHDLLEVSTIQKEVDICLLSEPNKAIADKRKWHADERTDAAISIINKKLCVVNGGKGKGFVWLELERTAVYYSCYFSPNLPQSEFEVFLEELGDSLRDHADKRVIIGGDFNSAATEWGSERTDKRGWALLEWAAVNDLFLLNDGSFTYSTGNKRSAVDLTFCSERARTTMHKWRVLTDEETLSDHLYVEFQQDIDEEVEPQRNRWNCRKLNEEVFVEELARQFEMTTENLNDRILEDVVCNALDKAAPKIHPASRNRSPRYWWTSDIMAARKECLKARRAYTRSRPENREERKTDYKEKKKALNLKIRRSKEAKWNEICREVESDCWGLGYQIAMKKLGCSPPPLADEFIEKVVSGLFPTHPEERWELPQANDEEFSPITAEELEAIGSRIKRRKAAGPDGVPPEAVKILLKEHPEKVLEVLNELLKKGSFPKKWKKGRLVLIPKPGKPTDQPSAYRPLCMISTLGKLFEAVIAMRLTKHLEDTDQMSEAQYGFRKNRSTCSAIERVMQIADAERAKTLRTRGLVLVILLDVKNAFNSIKWGNIMMALRDAEVPLFLQRILGSYLADRHIVIKGKTFKMSAGVPQGSILGPILWNVAYNGVLELSLPNGVELVGYADDLAVVCVARNEELLERRANEALEKIGEWMQEHHLALAPNKTEAVFLTGRKTFRPIQILLEDHLIEPTRTCKYLGVILDQGLTFGPHVDHVTRKAAKATASLSQIMPRMRGPGEHARRLLAGVTTSIVLYASRIWRRALQHATHRAKLEKKQRMMAMRICRAYRTVSTDAAFVIARQIPYANRVRELTEETERDTTMDELQRLWDTSKKGRWTHRLIPRLDSWYQREHGEVGYHLTQALTGHGCFQYYLCKYKKAASPGCLMCSNGENDTAEHTLFSCDFFNREREQLEEDMGEAITADKLIPKMLESIENWRKAEKYIEGVLRSKEEAERRREREPPR